MSAIRERTRTPALINPKRRLPFPAFAYTTSPVAIVAPMPMKKTGPRGRFDRKDMAEPSSRGAALNRVPQQDVMMSGRRS